MAAEEQIRPQPPDFLPGSAVVVSWIAADVSHVDADAFRLPREIFREIGAQFGAIDVAVNSADWFKGSETVQNLDRSEIPGMPNLIAFHEMPKDRIVENPMCVRKQSDQQRLFDPYSSPLIPYCPMSKSRTIAAFLIAAAPAMAQPVPKNGRTVTLAHIELNSADPDSAIAFWTDIIGTSTHSSGSLNGVGMIGALILFARRVPTGPSAGTAIDHLGLRVPDLQPFLERLAKSPYKSFQPNPGEDVLMIDGPDGVRIELIADSSMYASLQFDHIHFRTSKPSDTQAWYAKYFGARPDPDDPAHSSRLSGAALTFGPADSSLPTSGRAIDHLSFEVKDLASLSSALAADGIRFDPPDGSAAEGMHVFLTDPWGTRIELTEAGGR